MVVGKKLHLFAQVWEKLHLFAHHNCKKIPGSILKLGLESLEQTMVCHNTKYWMSLGRKDVTFYSYDGQKDVTFPKLGPTTNDYRQLSAFVARLRTMASDLGF